MMKKYWGFFILVLISIPLVYSLRTFVVSEADKISLEPKIEDPDKDNLEIYYTSPLDDQGEWQTNYGDAGNYTVKITVSDGIVNATEEVLIIVNKNEAPPVIIAYNPLEPIITINENDNLDFEITASDPNNDTLSYSWYLDGSFLSKDDKYTYGTNYESAGFHDITVAASDGKLETKQKWQVIVQDINTPPKLEAPQYAEVNEGEEVAINLKASDEDGDAVIFLTQDLPNGSEFKDGTFLWRPDYDAVKLDSFSSYVLHNLRILSKTFAVKFIAESRNLTDEKEAYIKVKNINRAPILEDIPTINARESEAFYISPKAYDLDGNIVKFSYSGWISSNSYTPSYDEQGTYYVKVTANDGLLEDSKFARINVEDINLPPEFKKLPNPTVYEGEELTITLEAEDKDNDKLSYSIITKLKNSTLESNIFTWTPDFNTVKTDSSQIPIEFSVSDGKNEARINITVTVQNVNQKPEIIEAQPQKNTFKVNDPITFSVEVIDKDNDKLSYNWDFSLFDKYDGGSIHKRIFTTKGDKKVKVTISDGKEEVEHEWNIKVN